MNFPTSQTPPPPAPGQPIMPAMPPEPAGPGLSQGQRLINMFFAPSKTFEDVKRKPSWWVPWLVTGIFTIVFGVVAVQKLDIERFIEQQIEKSPSAQRRMEQVPPERRAQIISAQATGTKVVFYVFPVVSLIGGLIIAAILMGVFNFILG